MDGQRLHVDLRRVAAHGSGFGRPIRTPARVHRRPGDLHRGIGARGARAEQHRTYRRSRNPGSGRGNRYATDVDHPLVGSERAATSSRPGRMGRHRRTRDRDRPGRRWRDRAGRELALDLLAQRAHRHRRRGLRLLPARGNIRSARPTRHRGPRPRERRPARRRLGSHQRQRARLDRRVDPRRADRRRRAAHRVRDLGAAHRGADAAARHVPQPRLHRRERRVAAHVLRNVRRDLPALAVLPGRPGREPVRGRPARPAVDRDAHRRRADCRRPERSHRCSPDRHDGPGVDVHRSRLAGRDRRA